MTVKRIKEAYVMCASDGSDGEAASRQRMKAVYLVSRGSYSDYRVVAVFSSRKRAQDFIDLVADEEWNEIEKYELDPPTVDLVRKGYRYFQVEMLRDGSVLEVSAVPLTAYAIEDCPSTEKVSDFYFIPGSDGEALAALVWAKDERHAVKIVNDKRAQMIATNKWKG
jgi:hypothetical protein